MRSWSFRSTLKNMYPHRDEMRPEFRAELEAKVMTRYQDLYSRRRKWTTVLNPRNRIGRYAVGTLLVVALTGAACELPTSTPVEMGHRVNLKMTPADQPHMETPLDAELREALAAAGAEKIEVRLARIDVGEPGMESPEIHAPHEMDVLVWGQHVSQDEIARVVEQHVDKARILTVDVQPLTGSVSETLGKRIGRRLFGGDISGETAEELRAAILARLAEQGFDNAHVEVQDDGNARKITVEAGKSDGSGEIADEVIIERREN